MRFDQPDPYGGSYDMTNPQSLNRYSYVLNDPVNFVDPSGLDPTDPPSPPPTTHIDPATGLPTSVAGPSASVTITFSQIFGSGSLLGGDSHAQLLVVFLGIQQSSPQNPALPPARPVTINGTPPPPPTVCGVNPVTGTPGFTRNPMGVTGHMRPSIGGDGWFGARRSRNSPRTHSGIDIAGVLNTTPVVAFLAGTVTFAGHTPGAGGTLVNIDHGNGITSSYVHLQIGSIPPGG